MTWKGPRLRGNRTSVTGSDRHSRGASAEVTRFLPARSRRAPGSRAPARTRGDRRASLASGALSGRARGRRPRSPPRSRRGSRAGTSGHGSGAVQSPPSDCRLAPMAELVRVHPEVAGALEGRRPVVALETTLVAHGFPAREGGAVGLAAQAAVRDAGAVPATIGIVDGSIRVGLSDEE